MVILGGFSESSNLSSIYAVNLETRAKIESSMLAIKFFNGSTWELVATSFVWDFVGDNVLILSNYHTWDSKDFKHLFPPYLKINKNNKKVASDNIDNIELQLVKVNGDVVKEFILCPSIFGICDKDNDFAIMKFSREGFMMKRLPVSLEVGMTMKIHAFGFIGHQEDNITSGCNGYNITNGEITALMPNQFYMSLLSAPGYSGAAIVSDGYGHAVGYMYGNLDAGTNKNSQHQSLGFTFDGVLKMVRRYDSPPLSPEIVNDSSALDDHHPYSTSDLPDSKRLKGKR